MKTIYNYNETQMAMTLKIRNPFLSDHIVNQIRICNPQSFFLYVFQQKKMEEEEK